jgi:hypothetical protein
MDVGFLASDPMSAEAKRLGAHENLLDNPFWHYYSLVGVG